MTVWPERRELRKLSTVGVEFPCPSGTIWDITWMCIHACTPDPPPRAAARVCREGARRVQRARIQKSNRAAV